MGPGEFVAVPMDLRVDLVDVFALVGLAFCAAGLIVVYLAKASE